MAKVCRQQRKRYTAEAAAQKRQRKILQERESDATKAEKLQREWREFESDSRKTTSRKASYQRDMKASAQKRRKKVIKRME